MNSSQRHNRGRTIRLPRGLRSALTLLLLSTGGLTVATFAAPLPAPYELATWRGFRASAVSYTFDDNSPKQFSVAQPMFDAKGLPATFFCIVGNLSTSQWATIESASAKGHEIASHTLTHPDLTKLTDARLATEESESNRLIESHTGKKCVSIAYPFCTVPKRTITSEYYPFARSCNEALVPSTPPDFLSVGAISSHMIQMNTAADNAATSGQWLVWLIHGIDDDPACCPITSTNLQSHLDYVTANTNKWWIETFGNVCRYIQERDAAVLTVVSDTTTNITLRLTHQLDNTIFNYPVTVRRPLPRGWPTAAITQSGAAVPSQIVNGNLTFDVVPNGGEIVLAKLEPPLASSKPAPGNPSSK
jgi:peptidoglycan/xylan/chitin deacetylase (PgdA/CDA1 family)